MIDKYLEHGEMFILDDNCIKAECVVTQESAGSTRLKIFPFLLNFNAKVMEKF
ncbi:hypothetical protein MKD05_11020 [[Clostridium] innocuum]|nr:hypothetical protein [[Clostridium] innocuum]